jgi:hypothetical protein
LHCGKYAATLLQHLYLSNFVSQCALTGFRKGHDPEADFIAQAGR